jgi:hypothetical protein
MVHHPSDSYHGSAGCRLEIIHMKILERHVVSLKFDLVMFLIASLAYGVCLIVLDDEVEAHVIEQGYT